MDNRQTYISLITKRLTYLQKEVENFNSLNLTDINIFAENFYRDLFNLIGFKFNNTNFQSNNFAHIDLIDTVNKQAIQVTSQNDNIKIKEAIDGFFAKPENQDYKLQLLLISKNAKDYRTKFGKTFNHKEDVLDIKRLLAIINDIKEIDTIKNIADFLNNNVLTERKKTECSEVETIMELINYLSLNKNRVIIDKAVNVDPKNKIENRFSEHSDYLKKQYSELYAKYNGAFVEATSKIDGVEAEIISDFLKDESDIILTKENNNPKLALHSLVELFYNKLSSNGVKFDKQAIKFYLLEELIKCNVFPNK
ncbi:SMEK domain-containing protein [Algoriphagus persicinus]|uniref:SMEK domain-containing protein n=1 Tax=Algoriphagus persicinus TaxID=3108754 RepID=UPI002B3D1F31|nr:SMEK domain-containing protein [Algoriphagus sp. E1-3-M2]MEB2786560.1 SMEK domain-containing protein [Algoriphagus sp. E1-3-M2]